MGLDDQIFPADAHPGRPVTAHPEFDEVMGATIEQG